MIIIMINKQIYPTENAPLYAPLGSATTNCLEPESIEIIPYGLSLGKIVILALLSVEITTPFRGLLKTHVKDSVNSGVVSFIV